MNLMKRHPHSDIFDMLDDAEFEQLVDDIAKNGLLFPITYVRLNGEDLLVDGRNRELACQKAGVEPKYKRLSDDTDVLAYVGSANMLRRHMTRGRLAIASVEIEKRYIEENKKRMKQGLPNPGAVLRQGRDRSSNAIYKAAAAVGISSRLATKAKRVVKNAPSEIVEAIKSDLVSVDDAEQISTLSHEVQRDLLEKVRNKKAQTLVRANNGSPPKQEGIRKRAEQKRAEVLKLSADGMAPADIARKTGYAQSFISSVVPGRRRANGVLFNAIAEAEALAEVWKARADNFLSAWQKAPAAEKQKYVDALAATRVAAGRLIKRFKESMEVSDVVAK